LAFLEVERSRRLIQMATLDQTLGLFAPLAVGEAAAVVDRQLLETVGRAEQAGFHLAEAEAEVPASVQPIPVELAEPAAPGVQSSSPTSNNGLHQSHHQPVLLRKLNAAR
jgi:hypothetical protein